ncbi:ester cyclase [Tropicibacter oceani]|uniref:Ester cyclase n=1 Tax=Tropicibacter oceani TaxID=3058420 RepID=A0ABY8QM93_9RHOB|nr:ester cyclase [Tropicibacter oceani]WGW05756.1 ester cyclase [Tropicibacter oceani]
MNEAVKQTVPPLGTRAMAQPKPVPQPDGEYPAFLTRTAQVLRRERSLGGALKSDFHAQVIRRDALGIGFGRAAVLADLHGQMNACPDQQALSEDVLCSGNDLLGMLGAQRLLLRGHHRGPGPFGAPTGRPLIYREMSETYAKGNRISDIWVVRDTGAICAQLGLEPETQARRLLAAADPETAPFRPEIDAQGPYTGEGNENQWGKAFAELVMRVMDDEMQTIAAQYDDACQLDYPEGRCLHGPDEALNFWMGLRAAFPSARFTVQHCIGVEDPLMSPRAAIRWSLEGTHDGWGLFGAPSGAFVHVMGMSHAEFGPLGVRREWTLYDALAIWMQIARHRG